MGRAVFLIGLLVSLFLPGPSPSLGARSEISKADNHDAQVPGRAIWVWSSAFPESPEGFGSLLDFVRSQKISAIFLFVSSRRFNGREELYRTFLRRAHAQGLRVDALNGEPVWLFTEHRDKAAAFINQVTRFNSAGAPDERFDAIHLDVEPQALPDWKTGRRSELARDYLEFLAWCRARVPEGEIPLVADIPNQFERIDAGSGNLAVRAMDLVNELVLMCYRKDAKRIIDEAQPLIKAADGRGSKVWVGISPLPGHAAGTEHHGLSRTQFERIVLQVEKANRVHHGFAGVAVHDYRRLRDLMAEPGG